jgi:uncharacterized SAM-binding protein YcdF (DUF218 family)
MYFVLSKVLLFLLSPLLWVFVLIVVAFAVKRRPLKKRLFVGAIVLLYVLSIPLFINLLAHAWSLRPALEKPAKVYSCAIVLGGFSSANKEGQGFFNGAADRFIQGVKLVFTKEVSHILISGGNGNLKAGKFREAGWVYTQLHTLKIPDSIILIENNSRNTIENAQFSKVVLQRAGLKPPYLLVTSDFHMRRAYMIFKKEGLDVEPYPCDFGLGQGDYSVGDLLPDGSSLGGWNLYLKELVGYVVDKYK